MLDIEVPMKGSEKLMLFWVAVLLAIVVCVLAGPLLPWSAHKILHSSTAAAWAQAVGTVGAMLGGAGAIAWQVRFESRREALRDLQRAVDVAGEIQDMAVSAMLQTAKLQFVLRPDAKAEEVGRLVLDDDDGLLWIELHSVFEATALDGLSTARLKLAFLRAKNAFAVSKAIHDQIFQDAAQDPFRQVEIRRSALLRSLDLMKGSLAQIGQVIDIHIHSMGEV